MKYTRMLMAASVALLLTAPLQAEPIRENLYNWHAQDHSAWKAMSNYPLGYVIAGNKFFEPANTAMYATGFTELGQHDWTTSYTAPGFSSLDTFWKPWTNIGSASNPSGFFLAASGNAGGKKYYTLLLDKAGNKIQERIGELPNGIQFGGSCQSTDGGFVVVGGDNSGNFAIVQFNAAGEAGTSVSLPISAFGWSIQPANGGGYVLAGTRYIIRVDNNLNIVWTEQVSLPISPDGSAYTYTEFEEVLPLVSGLGFMVTGSAFSNSHSAAYSARFDWNGNQIYSKIHETVNTSLAGTPVNWTNSAIEMSSVTDGERDILYTWRSGPVSAGGALKFDRTKASDGTTIQAGGLLNTIPVQEAFTVRQSFVDRIVIGGTRGSYTAAYSYSTQKLP